MDHGDAERHAPEMQEAAARNQEQAINDIMHRLDANRELAEYLPILEERIAKLEQGK